MNALGKAMQKSSEDIVYVFDIYSFVGRTTAVVRSSNS